MSVVEFIDSIERGDVEGVTLLLESGFNANARSEHLALSALIAYL